MFIAIIGINNLFLLICSCYPMCLGFENFDLESIVTPLKESVLRNLLLQTNYDVTESEFLIDGFMNGFDIHYRGPTKRQSQSANIPLRIGTKEELWSKIMKEVKAKRVVGPYDKPPFENYIQSPVGLVPKAGGKTWMIFHLSYNF